MCISILKEIHVWTGSALTWSRDAGRNGGVAMEVEAVEAAGAVANDRVQRPSVQTAGDMQFDALEAGRRRGTGHGSSSLKARAGRASRHPRDDTDYRCRQVAPRLLPRVRLSGHGPFKME